MFYRETIFITGFPGFIASRLVEILVGSETQFYLLVQPQFIEQAMQEIEQIAELTSASLDSFVLVEGDITQPNLGISDTDLETIRFETTDIYHLAAAYDLAVSKHTAYDVNLLGTKNVNNFARSVRQLRRYNYVSTCYVAGKREGVILETDLEHNAGFRNYYEETKYLAEIEVEKLKSEMPVTIYRPSVVVGDSHTGETAKYDGIYYLINFLRRAPWLFRVFNIGSAKVRLNLVPVDFVIESMAVLARDRLAIGKTVALADPNPLSTEELFDTIAKEMTGRQSEFKAPTRLAEWFLNTGISPVLTGLPHHGVPYFFLSQTYDTSLADDLLFSHDLVCPRFANYVGNLLDFVEENPQL